MGKRGCGFGFAQVVQFGFTSPAERVPPKKLFHVSANQPPTPEDGFDC